jgi:hypothetical protein
LFAADFVFWSVPTYKESNMHEKELNRATTEVASSIDISGQATADEIKRSLRAASHPSHDSDLGTEMNRI